MRYSANLGFLWSDLPLQDGVRAAAAAGFDAVECHWPYETDPALIRAALAETGLQMLGLNVGRGDLAQGENGLAAVPGREAEARRLIDQALAYAAEIDVPAVHVLAGRAAGPLAEATYVANLSYAAQAAAHGARTILIEPLNSRDAPGYFLSTVEQALRVIEAVGAPNVKLMFDCYHVQLMEADLTHRLQRLLPHIGHIQFASVPERGPPDRGEVNFSHVFKVIAALGWDAPLGAEYKPRGATETTLGWLNSMRGGAP